jgi:hypothetical protein
MQQAPSEGAGLLFAKNKTKKGYNKHQGNKRIAYVQQQSATFQQTQMQTQVQTPAPGHYSINMYTTNNKS